MAKGVLNRVARLARQPDLLLIVVFATILLMMILPLPALLMDILIMLNITASIIILIMALQLKTPVHFSTFPSLLLLATLFRLAISISTTRLILLEGSAGQIVETFGSVVVGGNLVVGLVIFLIITVVQFLVITKGADRVAEVGARFTLDGMPGKQMSVDADVRAGNMDQAAAKTARTNLERETKLFGAMDGAMKFFKGDAMAGLVITAINLIGGIAIGMTQFGYSFSGALELYALLTIGDGLVAQIPALLISVPAGTIVTRVTNPNGADLATEISEQITENRRNLIIAGIVIALFGLIPGFPTGIFAAVGLGISAGVAWNTRNLARKAKQRVMTWPALIRQNHNWCAERERKSGEPVKFLLKLPKCIERHDPQRFYSALSETRNLCAREFGVPLGIWRIEMNPQSEDTAEIYIANELVEASKFYPDHLFVKANATYLSAFDIPVKRHFGPEEACLVHKDHGKILLDENVTFFSEIELLLTDIRTVIGRNLHLFLDIQVTMSVLDSMKRSHSHMVRDLTENLTTNQISTVLRLLVQERIPFTAPAKIFETILEWGQKRTDPHVVLQQVRLAISNQLSKRYAPDDFLQCIIIAPTLESYIREGFRTAEDQRYLILENSISTHIAAKVSELTRTHNISTQSPVIVTQQDIRRALFNVLQQHGHFMPVLAYQEIRPQTTLYPVGFIGPAEEWEAAA